MVAEQATREPDFTGTRKFKTIGARAFEVLRAHGMFMSGNAPIRIPVEELTDFLVDKDGVKKADVLTALRENPDIFAIETRDEVEYVVTTREGHPPNAGTLGITHSFAERFMTPEPKPVRPVRPPVVRVRVDPNWATYAVPDFGDEDDTVDEVDIVAASADAPTHLDAETVAPEPSLTAPVLDQSLPIVDLVEEAAPLVPAEPAAEEQLEEVVAATQPEVAVEAEPEPVAAQVAEPAIESVETSPVAEPEIEQTVEPAVEPVVAPPLVVPPVAQVVAPPVTAPPTPTFRVSDLSAYADEAVAAAIDERLASDSRFAHFAGQWMLEERVPRLSRGDLRRMKEYIQEQEQPLTDTTLVQDILNVRPNSVEFPLMQFAVNFRLSREHRDFDFVGTNGQRFWSTSGLPQIGTTRRKPNEIGTDYRFLLDEGASADAVGTATSIDHVLSFYEHSLGLLPYDAEMQTLLPRQVSDDQRAAVLTFEIPQSYTTYLVELRYPTPNRGGFLLGLDDFYADNLVPGAMISIAATENDGHFRIEYLPAADQNARLMELDDRRSARYLFRPATITCEVDPDWLISEDRFPRLGSERPLDDKVRRRPEAVVDATFVRIGIEDGDSFIASFPDLLAAVNIERPFSPTLLRTVLEQDARVTGDGSDTYTYVAAS
ncbi:MAG: hypothetical protein AVDCRST_MAG87-1257 [uncultured Thermomicrobiales bacterium]|uniref:Uncharacterized protein n=1 Tax=uncultured Thermomicrobiales bacterium TaxID=1645740 RepID=A0A6J4USG3_9BACT|nr:MAG: hypothetical protein AVDCRST_MAG87-1257 [uncultured Thermomicrobiales bacterium]